MLLMHPVPRVEHLYEQDELEAPRSKHAHVKILQLRTIMSQSDYSLSYASFSPINNPLC